MFDHNFPAPPRRPAEYVLACYNGHTNGVLTIGWCTRHATKTWLDCFVPRANKLFGKFEWSAKPRSWLPYRSMLWDKGEIVVDCLELEDIYNYKLNAKELEWKLPIPYTTEIEHFLRRE